MGTIPIYWGEAAGLAELIGGAAAPHWAREQLEARYRLVPLDYLAPEALASQSRLLLAQPRGLTPEENVALDAWVRAGGHLLLFADPLMTGESRFGIGDRRRPQDVALLSPILGHWGLQLEFDEAQEPGIAMREIAGTEVPVSHAGRFAMEPAGGHDCQLSGEAVLARCHLESGEIVILADAALLDHAGPWTGSAAGLEMLTRMAFGDSGENAGMEPAEEEIVAR